MKYYMCSPLKLFLPSSCHVIYSIHLLQPSASNQQLVDLEVSLIGTLCQFVDATPQDNEQHPVSVHVV